MNLLAWVPNSWKLATWRLGAWLSDAYNPTAKRTYVVGGDPRVSGVSVAQRVSAVVADTRRAAVGVAATRTRLVVADPRTLAPAPASHPSCGR